MISMVCLIAQSSLTHSLCDISANYEKLEYAHKEANFNYSSYENVTNMTTANLVLTECHERITARNPTPTPNEPKWLYHDIRHPGLMTVRGENVTICATVDLDTEETPRGLKWAEKDVVRALADQQKAESVRVEKAGARALKRAGFELSSGLHV